MFPIDPLEEEQKREDDIPNGKFIRHIDFDNSDISQQQKRISYIYEYDHDFICI